MWSSSAMIVLGRSTPADCRSVGSPQVARSLRYVQAAGGEVEEPISVLRTHLLRSRTLLRLERGRYRDSCRNARCVADGQQLPRPKEFHRRKEARNKSKTICCMNQSQSCDVTNHPRAGTRAQRAPHSRESSERLAPRVKRAPALRAKRALAPRAKRAPRTGEPQRASYHSPCRDHWPHRRHDVHCH